MRFDVKVVGVEKIEKRLIELPKKLFNGEVTERIGALMLQRTRRRFLASEAPDGSKWEPSQAALRRKARGQYGPTLYDTGELFRSIHPEIEKTQGILGTDIDFAPEHQFGLAGQKKRTFLGFNSNDIEQMLIIARKQVDAALL